MKGRVTGKVTITEGEGSPDEPALRQALRALFGCGDVASAEAEEAAMDILRVAWAMADTPDAAIVAVAVCAAQEYRSAIEGLAGGLLTTRPALLEAIIQHAALPPDALQRLAALAVDEVSRNDRRRQMRIVKGDE